jgi:hypothetical protein
MNLELQLRVSRGEPRFRGWWTDPWCDPYSIEKDTTCVDERNGCERQTRCHYKGTITYNSTASWWSVRSWGGAAPLCRALPKGWPMHAATGDLPRPPLRKTAIAILSTSLAMMRHLTTLLQVHHEIAFKSSEDKGREAHGLSAIEPHLAIFQPGRILPEYNCSIGLVAFRRQKRSLKNDKSEGKDQSRPSPARHAA